MKKKRKELESLTNEKINNTYREANEVEDKISKLTNEQHRVLNEIHEKEIEINKWEKNKLNKRPKWREILFFAAFKVK